MPSLIRFLRLMSLVIWVGGIAFFAFVLAPVAFHSLSSAHEAGMVVRGSLLVLHWIGVVCGILFLGASLVMRRRRISQERARLTWQIILAVAMLVVTLVSQTVILPAMERDRQSGGGIIDTLKIDDARRVDFERLHVLSERLEGAVLFFGLGILWLMAREERSTPTEP